MTLERIFEAAVNSMIHGHHAPHCFSAHVPGKGYIGKGDGIGLDRADYLKQLERAARSEVDNLLYAEGYAEPGYTDPAKGVVFANWNSLPSNLDTILERAGYAVEYSDEWAICDDCQKAVRTSPDSYGWRRSYLDTDGGITCANCARENPDVVEEYLLNSATRADTFDIDWAARGFTKLNTEAYQSGWHPGQTDDPKVIAKQVPAGHDFLFAIPSVGQFDVNFDCWIRKEEA